MAAAATHTGRSHRWLTRTAIVSALATLALVLPAGAAEASKGYAAAGCAQQGSGTTTVEVCAGPVTGWGRGPSRYAYKHLSGSARYTERREFGCWSSTVTATGRPTYFSVSPNHTAEAKFAMTGERVETASSYIDENGQMFCSEEFTTTPIEPWTLDVAWIVASDPSQRLVCFSVAGCGSSVPKGSVRR